MKTKNLKTIRLNQLHELADHGDLLPYQQAELNYLVRRKNNSNFRMLIFTFIILAIIAIII